MTTYTKEQMIAHLSERNEFRRTLLEAQTQESNFCEYLRKEIASGEIALAALTAEPIGAFHIADQQVDGTSDYIKDGEWPIDNGIIEVYAMPVAETFSDVVERLIGAIEKEQDRLLKEDYMMDSEECIDVIREEMQRINTMQQQEEK